MSKPASTQSAHEEGRRVLGFEAETLRRLSENLDGESFNRATEILLGAKAHVIVTGMGKSGHVGAKIAATFASTGTPAFFLHPAEAVHGDLGMLTRDNVLLALSHSGATDEILNLLPYAQHERIPVISITGRMQSALAERSDVVLLTEVDQEACPLNLAPTASTIAQMAMGDALAAALMQLRGFQAEDFAIRHPLGSLGRRLLVRVRDLMVTGDQNPVLPETATVREAIDEMTTKRQGAVALTDEAGTLTGIFCDGDLRRLFLRGPVDVNSEVREVMVRQPKRVHGDLHGAKAVDLMETHKITVLPVVDDDDQAIGMIHLHSLIEAGIWSEKNR
ncbi:KpsF/GutQ family sugar-phosphate isomerase [bacterium]|nr:KpsF/GutQ family sugar-phosphate isomerase [bacterium]